MRDECKGCIFDGKAVQCACLDLQWAWHDLLKEIPLLRVLFKEPEPEPCWLREMDTRGEGDA